MKQNVTKLFPNRILCISSEMERKIILRLIFYFVVSNSVYSVMQFKMSFISANNPNNRIILQVLFVFILSSSNNDVTIKITIELVIDHY
jgi:hypothetical protein